MDRIKWLILVVFCSLGCLPEGHPPVEYEDIAKDAVGDDFSQAEETADSFKLDSAPDKDTVDFFDSFVSEPADDAIDSIAEQTDDGGVIVEDEQTLDTVDAADAVDTPKAADEIGGVDSADDGAAIAPEVASETQEDAKPDETTTIECPPGQFYDPKKGICVSFCDADQYFEKALGKCLYYPCCDVSGNWEVNVVDTDTMLIKVYSLALTQTVSYLKGKLSSASPVELVDCWGILENQDFTLICTSGAYTLTLTSGTTEDSEIVGFYSYNYADGKVKNGPVNMKKL